MGPGNVLGEIIESEKIPFVELNEIFRQAKGSNIIINAHRVNRGLMPEIVTEGSQTDFYFIEQDSPERVLTIILELVKKRIPDRFALDPFSEIQVISPMHKGVIGTENLKQGTSGCH